MQKCCSPGSALKIQLSTFPPSTLQISDDREQRVRAGMITKLPGHEDEQEGKGGRHQQWSRAALAPKMHWGTRCQHHLVTGDGKSCCASQEGTGHICPQSHPTQEHPRWKTEGQNPSPAASEPLVGKCHPATGQLQPQDRFLLLLFICKAPRKETRWFVHTELWLLLVTELACNCAKASGHSSFLKGHPRNPSHISPGFYGVLSSSGH